MDIPSALAILSHATAVIKDLRNIDKGFDVAVIKAQMADLYGTLADVKIALSDAREAIAEKDRTIKQLEDKIAAGASGEQCPLCGERMKVTASIPHPHFSWAGHQERTLTCQGCGHSEMRHFKPDTGIPSKR